MQIKRDFSVKNVQIVFGQNGQSNARRGSGEE